MKKHYPAVSLLSKNFFFKTPLLFILLSFVTIFVSQMSTAQTTWNFSTAAPLSKAGGFYFTEATMTIGGVNYKLTHLGNGNFTNQANGGNGNTASLKKDGAGGDFLKIERADGLPFQFYGLWLKTSSMYNPPFYQPPYYNVKYYDQNNAEIVAETFSSNTQNETITISKNLKVNYVYVTLNAILTFIVDDLIVGPAAASAPTVTSASINQFTAGSAVLGGNVTSDGGASVTERGIVYNTTGSPTTANTKVQNGTGTGSFTQTVTGLSSNTMYYIRAYSINSAGTSYGSQLSFTTAASFLLAQTHYFNTAWVSTTSQATPFTKFVEGWDITGTGTGAGLLSVIRITGTTGLAAVGEGVASARVISITTAENLVSVEVKPNNNSSFDLQSFKFKYLVKTAGSSFGTITVTGYRNAIAVPGAVASMTNVAEATASVYAYSTFNLTANNNFNNIDKFIITVSNPVNSARLSAIDIDALNVTAASTLPLTLVQFTGKADEGQAQLQWKTAQEQNTANFQVEYSTDGSSFKTVGNVAAAGNSATERNYTFTHAQTIAGINFYRLKMVDRDAKYSYSPVVKVQVSTKADVLVMYPNPITGDYFTIEPARNNATSITYTIYNNAGITIKEGTITRPSQKIPVDKLGKGNYFIRLSNGQAGKLLRQ